MAVDLHKLAVAVRELNDAAAKVSTLIGRPALTGHVGEAIAAAIFDIRLAASATNRGYDGHFGSGPLAGRSVNVKLYPRHERVLDVNPGALPDYFLVLAGPTGSATSSKGKARPWAVDTVFLLDAEQVIDMARSRGTKVGIATSVPKAEWTSAEIYPVGRCRLIEVGPEQRALLAMFSSGAS